MMPALGRPLSASLSLFAGLAVGALGLLYLAIPVVSLAACIIALPASGLAMAVICIRREGNKHGGFLLLGLAAGLMLGGAQSFALFIERESAYAGINLREVRAFRAVLKTDSILTRDNLRLYSCALESVATKSAEKTTGAEGTVLVTADNGPALYCGQIIEAEAGLKDSSLPGDVRFYAAVKATNLYRRGFSHPLFALRSEILAAFLDQIAQFGSPASSLFEALFLGVKDNLQFELRDSFQKTGSLHLLALSGLNVGMVVALLMLMLSPLRGKRAKLIVALFLVAIYLFLVGPEPSLLRAVLMLFLVSLGILLDRAVNPLVILLASVAIVLVVDPASVHSLSFQLSYLALFGILTLGKRIDAFLIPYLPRFFRTLLAAALSAQIFSAPLVLSAFGALYPVGLIVSLFLIPLTTAYIWSGVVLLILTLLPWPMFQEAAQALMGIQYRLIVSISEFFQNAPSISLAWQDWYWIPALAVLLLLVAGNPIKRVYELRLTL